MNHAGLNGNDTGNFGGNGYMPDWDQYLRMYRQDNIWNSDVLGPPPGHAGCRVPALLLQHYGYDPDFEILIDPPHCGQCKNGGHKHAPHEDGLHEHGNTNRAEDEPRAGADWPDPCPLPESLLAVDPFKLNLMPEKLLPWVADVTERMQCPPDFVAVSVMAGLGSLVGRKVVIRPQAQNDWQEFANMWALPIGRPGLLKSPAMEEALRPLKRLSIKAEEAFKKARLEYEVEVNVAKLRAQENIKRATKILQKESTADVAFLLSTEEEAPEPTLRRYIANDTNVASLGVLLQQNPNGLMVFRDELVSLLDSLDQEVNASERGFYLTAWSGNSSYTFDRIGRGLHLHIEGMCLSMLGSTQPGRISQYLSRAVRGGRGDDGLIQRFGLMVWPDISPAWTNVDRWPDKDARTTAFQIFEYLDGLDWHAIAAKRDRGAEGDDEGLPYLRFGLDANERFVEWRTELEKRLRSGDLHPALESHLAKYRKLVPGLALISHLVDGGTGSVGLAALARAVEWARYLETHARRAYGSATAVSATTAKCIVAKIRSGDLKSEFRSHEVWRPGWSKLTDSDAVRAALEMLVDYDWLRVRKLETAGRPAFIYTVNPKIFNA
ncbi:MAG: YfjI family protein [Xanthobacteraceae bacterium]